MEKLDWNQFNRGVFLINVLAIIIDPETGKILAGRRKDDPFLKQISWTFPGGRPSYNENLEHYLKLEVKKKTNLNINVKEILFARSYPEERRFLSIYYLCEIIGGRMKPGEKFIELKWFNLPDLKKAGGTSIHPEFYQQLQKLCRPSKKA